MSDIYTLNGPKSGLFLFIQRINFFDRRNPLWLCRGEEPIIRWVMRNKCMLRVIMIP